MKLTWLPFLMCFSVLISGSAPAQTESTKSKQNSHPKQRLVKVQPKYAGGDICEALLDQGIRDVQSSNISESRFNEIKASVCTADYDSYSKAQSESASGGFDIPGYFGISASDANANTEYSTKWSTFCGADYSKATSDSQIRTFVSTINQGILGAFNHCVDVNSERFIRYVQPDPAGSQFTIVFQNRGGGVGGFRVDQLTILDATTNRKLDPTKDCDLPSPIPYDTNGYTALNILCTKSAADTVVVSGKATLGLIDPVSVPAVPTPPPSVADRVTVLEGGFQALKATVAANSNAMPDTVLASLPRGTVLLFKGGAPRPAGWKTCSDIGSDVENRFLRVSPDSSIPQSGGSAQLYAVTNHAGFTYDGGKPADPGGDTRRSPGPDERMQVDMPEYTYVTCLVKQ